MLALPSNVTGSRGNPVLLFGLNRTSGGSASGGANGARNNTYLIDGVDVTNPETGTGRTQLPPELIQVQDIKTGGITAEYSARAGLFSNATTRSGGNEFSGGAILEDRGASLQSKPASGRFDVAKEKTTDLNVWALGPLIKDKLWFVVDAQKVSDSVEVHPPAGNAVTPSESRTGSLAEASRFFGKLTWQITDKDQAAFSYNRDPSTSDTLVNPNVRTNRGDKLELYSGDGPYNNILSDTAITGTQKFIGDSSSQDLRKDVRTELRGDLTWLFDAAGHHTLKGGVQVGQESLERTTGIAQGASYESYIAPVLWGNTAAFGGNVNSFKNKIIAAINSTPGLVSVLGAAGYTATGPGGAYVSTDLNSYLFNKVNPYGGYNSYRYTLESANPSKPHMDKKGVYLQDQWQVGNFTFSPGIRFDDYTYVAEDRLQRGPAHWPRLGCEGRWPLQGLRLPRTLRGPHQAGHGPLHGQPHQLGDARAGLHPGSLADLQHSRREEDPGCGLHGQLQAAQDR